MPWPSKPPSPTTTSNTMRSGYPRFLFWLAISVLITLGVHPAEAQERRTMRHDGQPRSYLIQKPDAQDQLMPVVILLHGGTQSARKVWRQTSLPETALKEHFILVAPDAVDSVWNDGRQTLYGGRKVLADIDDVGFVARLINELVVQEGADPHRIYVTGASNGGMMTFRLACELSGKIAAAAPFIATMAKDAHTTCTPSRPLPIMITISSKDRLVPWEGGSVQKNGHKAEARLSANETADFWASANRCTGESTITLLPDLDPGDHTRIRKKRYSHCAAETLFYTVLGGGHTWPGGKGGPLVTAALGRTTRDMDAGEATWAFFRDKVLP